MAEMIGGVVLAILVGLGLFLILRYFWLWYWKIDKVVDLLERIDDNTRKPKEEIIPKTNDNKPIIKDSLTNYDGYNGIDSPTCSHLYAPNELKCPNCGRANQKSK